MRRVRSVWRTLTARRPSLPVFSQACSLCGAAPAPFLLDYKDTILREAVCADCGTSKRSGDVAEVLLKVIGAGDNACLRNSLDGFRGLNTLCTQSSGAIAETLRDRPGITISEYWDEVRLGAVYRGVRCEDLMALTFEDESLDLIVCEDILEHIPNPHRALAEVLRVLRRGGSFVFTVPDHSTRQTQTRARLDETGKVEHLLDPVWHLDPLRPNGALVFTDFGADLEQILEGIGFGVSCTVGGSFYPPEEQTWIATQADHARHLERLRAAGGHMGRVFRHDSRVWRASKP